MFPFHPETFKVRTLHSVHTVPDKPGSSACPWPVSRRAQSHPSLLQTRNRDQKKAAVF